MRPTPTARRDCPSAPGTILRHQFDMVFRRAGIDLPVNVVETTAIPVITSLVGVGGILLRQAEVGIAATTERDWYEALCLLMGRRDLGRRMGMAGIRLVTEKYSVAKNVVMLSDILRVAAER